MSREQDCITLCRAFSRGVIGRREFLERAITLGIGLSTIGALLTACSRDKGATGDEAVTKGGADSGKKASKPAQDGDQPSSGTPPELEKELRIYNWSDYIAEDTIPNFEREFGVKVIYDNYESNEEVLAKLQAGASGYDLVCPSGYSVPAMRALDLIGPLDRSLLPNLGNISDIFGDLPFDPGSAYTVPWQWGITGIAYRKDKVKAPVDSWSIFHNADYAGKMTQTDEMRDAIGAWLKFRGKSANSSNPDELEQAKKDALEAKKHLRSYVSGPVKGQLITGDVWIAQLWNGDTAQARAEQSEIEFVIPKEGGILWVDTMVVPRKAPHKRAAHAFLNYILRPEVGAAISDFTGYGSPNTKALARMKNPVPFPSESQRALLEFQQDLGEHSQLWDRIWTEIKAG